MGVGRQCVPSVRPALCEAHILQLQILAGSFSTNTIPIPIAATAPGIFTQDLSGRGLAAIAN